jgi:hypothetical protein
VETDQRTVSPAFVEIQHSDPAQLLVVLRERVLGGSRECR